MDILGKLHGASVHLPQEADLRPLMDDVSRRDSDEHDELEAQQVAEKVGIAEEIATIEPWLRTHLAALPAFAQPLADITAQQFAGGVAVLFALVSGILVANGLTHLGQAAYFRGYTPGVLTAVLVVLPYGLGLGRALVRTNLVP